MGPTFIYKTKNPENLNLRVLEQNIKNIFKSNAIPHKMRYAPRGRLERPTERLRGCVIFTTPWTMP